MKMIVKLISAVFKTDSLPIAGGAAGAVLSPVTAMFPTWEMIVYTILIASVGAITGYVIKLFLDWVIKLCKNK